MNNTWNGCQLLSAFTWKDTKDENPQVLRLTDIGFLER